MVPLAALREHGIRVAIDDFGTGYSSLSYLRQVSADVVKIDKSFVDGLGNANPHQSALVEGIVRLAQTLELGVVAEGIEEPGDHAAAVCQVGRGDLGEGVGVQPPVLGVLGVQGAFAGYGPMATTSPTV